MLSSQLSKPVSRQARRSNRARARPRRRQQRLIEDPDVPSSSSEVLGHYNPVRSTETTLYRDLGPFMGKKFVELVYLHAPSLQSTTAPGSTLSVLSNSGFDFDVTGNLGNKQPLYYDALLSSSGPYKSYKVISWRTKWTFINMSAQPVNIFISPPISATSEFDIVGEAEDFPGTKHVFLGPATGAKNQTTVTTTGHIRDVYPALPFSTTLVAAFSSSPSSTCYQNIVYANADGSSVTALYVGVEHTMFTELGQVDSIVS